MDLNYLYLRHQVSLVRADRAACPPSRAAHQGLAGLYRDRIERTRSAMRSRRRAGIAA